MYKRTCRVCGETQELVQKPSSDRCQPCFNKYDSPRNGTGNGWRKVNMGYIAGNFNGKWLLKHRVIMEKHLGRKLKTDEIVHHINEDKADNRLSNLEIVDRKLHNAIHKGVPERIFGELLQCNTCGEIKPFSEYYEKKDSFLGVEGKCKECRRAAKRLCRKEAALAYA
jgi:hypothetical protein